MTLVDEHHRKRKFRSSANRTDAKAGKISVTSPIARALIGKKKGTSVEVMTPKGAKGYEVLKIDWV
jgi:transcription elongation factor GreA